MGVELIKGIGAHGTAAYEFHGEDLLCLIAAPCIIMLGKEEILVSNVSRDKKGEKVKEGGITGDLSLL